MYFYVMEYMISQQLVFLWFEISLCCWNRIKVYYWGHPVPSCCLIYRNKIDKLQMLFIQASNLILHSETTECFLRSFRKTTKNIHQVFFYFNSNLFFFPLYRCTSLCWPITNKQKQNIEVFGFNMKWFQAVSVMLQGTVGQNYQNSQIFPLNLFLLYSIFFLHVPVLLFSAEQSDLGFFIPCLYPHILAGTLFQWPLGEVLNGLPVHHSTYILTPKDTVEYLMSLTGFWKEARVPGGNEKTTQKDSWLGLEPRTFLCYHTAPLGVSLTASESLFLTPWYCWWQS